MAHFPTIVAGSGGNVHRWSQNNFLGAQTFGSGGVCFPLVLKWIQCRRHRINFATEMRTPDAREEVMQLRINQARAANTFATDYLSMFGITRHFRQNFACPVSLNTFVPVFTTGPGYYVVGISALGLPGGAGGHALGVDMFAQKLFDPNFGEATFPNAQSMRQCFMLLFRLFYINLHGQAAVERYF